MVKKNSAAGNPLTPRERHTPASSAADTFRSEAKPKRTQLSIEADAQFRTRLAHAARALGITQRDLVYKAVERYIQANEEKIEQYTRSLLGK